MAKVNSSREVQEITHLFSWCRLHHFPLSPHRGVPLTSPLSAFRRGHALTQRNFCRCRLPRSVLRLGQLIFLFPKTALSCLFWCPQGRPCLLRLSLRCYMLRIYMRRCILLWALGSLRVFAVGERDVHSKGVCMMYFILLCFEWQLHCFYQLRKSSKMKFRTNLHKPHSDALTTQRDNWEDCLTLAACTIFWAGVLKARKLYHTEHLTFSNRNAVCPLHWSSVWLLRALVTVTPAWSAHTQGCVFSPSHCFFFPPLCPQSVHATLW